MKPRSLQMLDLFFKWAEQTPDVVEGVESDENGLIWFKFSEGSMIHAYLKIARDDLQDEFQARQQAPQQGAAPRLPTVPLVPRSTSGSG